MLTRASLTFRTGIAAAIMVVLTALTGFTASSDGRSSSDPATDAISGPALLLSPGMSVAILRGRLVIVDVAPGSPAAGAGLLPGDAILILNDTKMIDLDRVSPQAALDLLARSQASEFRLVIGRGPGIIETTLPHRPLPTTHAGFPPSFPPADGNMAPHFTGRDLEGRAIAVEDFRGRPVLVEFWASWCAPCRDSAITVRRLGTEYGDRLVIIGVSIDENPAAYEAFVYNNHLPGHQIHDGGWYGPISTLFEVASVGVPYAIVIDPEGRLAGMGSSVSQLESIIIRLVRGDGQAAGV